MKYKMWNHWGAEWGGVVALNTITPLQWLHILYFYYLYKLLVSILHVATSGLLWSLKSFLMDKESRQYYKIMFCYALLNRAVMQSRSPAQAIPDISSFSSIVKAVTDETNFPHFSLSTEPISCLDLRRCKIFQ